MKQDTTYRLRNRRGSQCHLRTVAGDRRYTRSNRRRTLQSWVIRPPSPSTPSPIHRLHACLSLSLVAHAQSAVPGRPVFSLFFPAVSPVCFLPLSRPTLFPSDLTPPSARRPSQPSSVYITSSNPLPIRVFKPFPVPTLPLSFSLSHRRSNPKSAFTPCTRQLPIQRHQGDTAFRFNWFLAPGGCDSSAIPQTDHNHLDLDHRPRRP